MELKGTVERLLPIVSGVSQKGNEWSKQEVVLLTEGGTYPRRCVAAIMGKEKIDNFALVVGESVTCQIDIDAREYNGRWYNSIQIWKVDRNVSQAPVQPQQPSQSQSSAPTPQPGDDLPF